MDAKSWAQTVMKDVPSSADVDTPEDAFADAEVGEHRPGYTKRDRGDMYRMGKRQELMASTLQSCPSATTHTI